jgi:phosphatidylglycerol lysyltransferase
VPFPAFVATFVLASALGLFSMIPGALGVLDGFLLVGLVEQGAQPAPVLGGILVFRLVHFVVPWIVAIYLGAGLLVTRDTAWVDGLARRWEKSPLLAALRLPTGLLSAVGVKVLSGLIFLAGVLLLLSAAYSTLPDRARLLAALPLPAVEGSHLLSVASGVLLIGLARGIASQLGSAYRLCMVLLVAGAALSLLKGSHRRSESVGRLAV